MCTRPLTAFNNPEGGRPIFGWIGHKEGLTEIKLPCGSCPECVKDYYTQWATRGSRELLRWSSSVFITLTYRPECLPSDNSLNKKHVQDFIKRVKRRFGSCKENPIRQTYCGEYGEKTKRPHYHVILFNCDFFDRVFHYTSDSGHEVYTSKILDSLWPFGFAEFGVATPASIAYIYKYVLKKKTRKEKKLPLRLECEGQEFFVSHEFVESSRNPGIGAHLRGSDSLKKGFLFVDGQKKKLPKYYLEWLRDNDLPTYLKLIDSRYDFASSREIESEKRRKQKEFAQKKLTDTKRKI